MDRPDDLDLLFAQARTTTPADLAAAERALDRHRAERQRAARARRSRSAWASGLLAAAAMLGTLVLVVAPRELPTSAAYDAYTQLSTEGW